MKTRLGLVLTTSLLVGAGACASGGGSTAGGGGGETAAPAGEAIPTGEPVRENEFTQAAETHLEQGDDALEEGNEAEARTHYQQAADAAGQAIAQDGTNPLPWLQGGLANLGLEEYQAADSMLSRAEELRPIYGLTTIDQVRETQWIALYQQAAPLVNEGEYAQAAEVLEQAHFMYQERPEAMLILGQLWAQQGRYDDAVQVLRQGLEVVDSEDAREEMDEETIAAWEEQAEGIPTVLAQSLVNAGHLEEGAAAFRELLEEQPDNLQFRQTLANIYVEMQQPDSALAIYSELMQREEMDSEGLYQIGLGLWQLEEYERAADAFSQAVAESPMDRDATEMWARALQIAHPPGDEETEPPPEAALEELKEASELWLELDPFSQTAYLITAQTVNRMGDQEYAAQLLEEANELPVLVSNLQFQRVVTGGGTVRGTIQNASLEQGTPVTVEVTFYGEGASEVGTESVTVEMPAVDATQSFEVRLQSDQQVLGYTYSIEGV